MIPREEVYAAIDSERVYQDKLWEGEFDDRAWSVGDWLIFMERYMEEAKGLIGYPESLDSVRKIGALAVACMEYQGAPKRGIS